MRQRLFETRVEREKNECEWTDEDDNEEEEENRRQNSKCFDWQEWIIEWPNSICQCIQSSILCVYVRCFFHSQDNVVWRRKKLHFDITKQLLDKTQKKFAYRQCIYAEKNAPQWNIIYPSRFLHVCMYGIRLQVDRCCLRARVWLSFCFFGVYAMYMCVCVWV